MSLLKKITDSLKSNQGSLCLVVLLVVIGCVALYSKQLGLSRAGMAGPNEWSTMKADNMPEMNKGALSEHGYKGVYTPGGGPVIAANPLGDNAHPSTVHGIQTQPPTGVPQSCLNQQAANPADLLPKDDNSGWGAASPRGAGELANVNLLKAGQLAGIDTVGGTLRNANLQLRSEPPNPKAQVSPWSNSTIEPDLMRVPLELGCGSQ